MMKQVLFRSIVDGWLLGLAIWFISQVGLVLSYYTLGPFIGRIFLVLAAWPNAVYSAFLPKDLPTSYYENAYLISCIVSLIGWVILTTLLALSGHIYAFARTHRQGEHRDNGAKPNAIS